ncbi:ArsR/SmtB family transcription factor [Paeniglutamicibacter psychrophenolicus]|uniref:ArsR/SmtB family transcription factor n=1 Tax=Paeniglutamicibacter psychrophenolicus TaxID=257454 RepID=UPI002783B5CF|nr:metalloregulator ArsR/SmtB family transcription factor [Paeniglutamicibacter psychrophenolicus]MDQ0096182.1 DNA-binding transcriptional ArsR family regulator [Paeniglutamicibacter psychrophenolicus]
MSTNVYCVPDVLETAAEPTRRALLNILANGEHTVGELAERFPVTRSAISQHLLLLAEVGLVAARKDGRNRFYRLDPAGMATLRRSLESFWTSELKLLVDEATGPQS